MSSRRRGKAGAKRPDKQIPTEWATIAEIMQHPNFARGLADIRAERPFPADYPADKYLAYERGRLFGAIAPKGLQLFIRGKLNPKAVQCFATAVHLIP